MKPVPPPARAMGRWPACCRRRRLHTWSRWPTCRLSARGVEAAVGGEAIGVETLLEAGSVIWWIEPAEAEILGEVGHGLSLPRHRVTVVPAGGPPIDDRPSGRHYDRTPAGLRRTDPGPPPSQEPPLLNPYLHGNFAPVLVERSDDHALPVTGVIPPDLCGQLLRNGPNPAAVPADEADYHWFAGDGMIHAITLSEGRADGLPESLGPYPGPGRQSRRPHPRPAPPSPSTDRPTPM